jgi:cholesterol oxidase
MAHGYDLIVIGSGFGGAVTACRLAEAGMKVLVLERGRRWDEYPYGPRAFGDAWFWDQERPERQNGWLDFRRFSSMWVAQAAGVGGGSLIYANVCVEVKGELFQDGWPKEITRDSLQPYYDRVTTMLRPRTIPHNQVPERYKLMQEAAEALGMRERFKPLPLAVSFNDGLDPSRPDPYHDRHAHSFRNAQGRLQGTCTHCGNCVIGCQVRAKNTLDLTYLAQAENHQAEIRPLHLVRWIEPLRQGYRVAFDQIAPGGTLKRGSEIADRVILAAGSLGSTELLLRCRDQYRTLPHLSPFLGRNWSSNGDFLTLAFYPFRVPSVSPTHGPTISSAIDLLDGACQDAHLFVEDGGLPDLLGQLLIATERSWKRGRGWRKLSKKFVQHARNRDVLSMMMPWFGQGIDKADGRLRLQRRWLSPWRMALGLDWDLKGSRAMFDAMAAAHDQLSRATGGIPLKMFPLFDRFLVTPHPLGGCNMGTTRECGVVDHGGQVFGYPNLYVADGSIIPEAIGLNPSKTIAALAERIADLMIASPADRSSLKQRSVLRENQAESLTI